MSSPVQSVSGVGAALRVSQRQPELPAKFIPSPDQRHSSCGRPFLDLGLSTNCSRSGVWSGVRTILSVDRQEKVGKKNENRKGKRLSELKTYRKLQKYLQILKVAGVLSTIDAVFCGSISSKHSQKSFLSKSVLAVLIWLHLSVGCRYIKSILMILFPNFARFFQICQENMSRKTKTV